MPSKFLIPSAAASIAGLKTVKYGEREFYEAHHMAGLYGNFSSFTISASLGSADVLREELDVLDGELASADM